MGQSMPLFSVCFRPIQLQIEKSINVMLEIRTWGRNMVGTVGSTEQWCPFACFAITWKGTLTAASFSTIE